MSSRRSRGTLRPVRSLAALGMTPRRGVPADYTRTCSWLWRPPPCGVLAAVDGGRHEVKAWPWRTPRWLIVSSASFWTARAAPRRHGDLEATVVVEMDVQGRYLEIVVAMLRPGEPPAEIASLMVVDIGEGGDALAVGRLLLLLACLRLAQDVAQRLRSAGIAAAAHVCWSSASTRSSSTERVMRCACPRLPRGSIRRRTDLVEALVAVERQRADPYHDKDADDDEAEDVGMVVQSADAIPELARIARAGRSTGRAARCRRR